MSESHAPSKPADRPSRGTWAGAGLVGVVALLVFGYDLKGEPHFADESAYLSQAYFADLWLRGDVDDPAWLEYPAFDLPPLPKYLIGFSLRAGGYPRPGREAMRTWYDDISFRCGTPEMLEAARRPSVVLGALGCVALYGLGVLAGGRRVGLVAALLLMANPLYRMHARRAMSDVPAEALILATAAVALWAWRRTLAKGWGIGPGLAAPATGVLGGLAVLAKLNGGLGLIIVAAWTALAATLPGYPARRKAAVAASALIAGGVAFLTFVAWNPFLTARPGRPLSGNVATIARMDLWERTRHVLAHRVEVSSGQQVNFSHNALVSPVEKVKAIVVQGFGRFGPFGRGRLDPDLGRRAFDSTRRYDLEQDWGAIVWFPWVALGALWAAARGRAQLRSGEPPTAWAVLLQALVALATVTAYIPLAWDRYYLSIQPGSALLAAGVAVAAADGLARLALGRREA